MQKRHSGIMKMERLQLDSYLLDIIDNPKEMLSNKEISLLVEECIPVARKGFGNEGITESDIYIHVVDVTTGIYIRDKHGNIIAFGGSIPEEVNGKKVIHLKGSAVLPEHQERGLYSILTPIRVLREAEKLGKGIYIGSRTQNPRVFEYMSERLGFFPKTEGQPPEQIKEIAKSYADLIQEKHSDFKSREGVVFDRDNLVVRRAYGGKKENGEEFGFCMYGKKIPHAKNPSTNEFMTRNLDFNNGDAVILLGKFNRNTYLNSLESTVKRLNPITRLYNRFG